MNIKKYFILGLISFFLYLFVILYQNFLLNIVIAFILIASTLQINIFLSNKIKNRFMFTLCSASLIGILFILPLWYFISITAEYISEIENKDIVPFLTQLKDTLIASIEEIPYIDKWTDEIKSSINPLYITNELLSIGKYIASISVNFIKNISIILIFYIGILSYHKELSSYIKSIIPFNESEVNYLFNSLSNNMGIVFYATLLTAILEGFLFGFFVSFFDYNGMLLGILFGFSSLIPIVGGILMWLPVALHEYFNGNLQNAIIVSLYTIIVISLITDTFIKAYIIKSVKKHLNNSALVVHELFIFFSIIAGITEFGFWGIILGPAIGICLFSLIELYKKNFLIKT